MDEEEIDVVNYDPNAPRNEEKPTFPCELCEFVGDTTRSLGAHKRHKHPKQEGHEEVKRQRGRPRKPLENTFSSGPLVEQNVVQERVTTKQLLGGRKRPKTIVDSIDDSALRTDREASRLHELGVIDEETSLGDYVRRGGPGYPIASGDMMGEMDAGAMVVGEEVVIDDGEQGNGDEIPMVNRNYVPRTRYGRRYPEKLPERLTVGDPTGKYKCYIETCSWKGGYRSLRMDHMKAIHPEWKMPPRYILQRISKDGVYIDPDKHVPQFACLVKGCDWRGNFRASRSTHMRKMHPNEHAEKKKNKPGYMSNGTYSCHYPTCSWRGWSRSTRSAHLKKAHPEWRPDDMRVLMVLTCFYCKSSFSSYAQLADHIATHGGIGLHVEEFFETREQFSAWLQRIEALYAITFERSELENPCLEETDMPPEFQNYILHCNCVGGRGSELAADARSYVYLKHNFLKGRPHQLVTRNKNDCSAHLEVREDSNYGPIQVKGTLEHTGHRFGTPLLRMAPMDRQLYADVMEWKVNGDFRFMALEIVEKLNTYEGFTMDNYKLPKKLVLIDPFDSDPNVSLRKLIEESEISCFFGVDFDRWEEGRASFGYMTTEMEDLWTKFGPGRSVTIDVSIQEFETVIFTQYTVLIADDRFVPKCVLLYLTTDPETGPTTVMEQLKTLAPRAPKDVMCDASQVWVDLIEKLYPSELPTIMISEWSLMDFWAAKADELVRNEFDVFSIVTALRRLLRIDDVHQMYYFIVEFLEAMYECGYDELADFFDVQLSDMDYFKRWSPVHRNSFTSHAHPTIGVASRTLRDLYLTNEGIERVDLWFAHATRRLEEFNDVQITQTFTLRPLDTPRKYFYTMMNCEENQMVDSVDQGIHHHHQMIVYEDDILAGEVVEEEVIGHEITEQMVEEGEEEELQEVVEEDEEIVEEMEVTLQEGEELQEELIYEEEIEQEQEDLQQHHHHQMQQNHHHRQQPGPSNGSRRSMVDVMEDEGQGVLEPRMKMPQHRMRLYEKPMYDEPSERGSLSPRSSSSNQRRSSSPLKRIRIPSRKLQDVGVDGGSIPRRETTKSVIRSRRKRDRFAELRDCPPEIMRAIAAHAIAYDGRKKEQRPFIYVPSEAKMGTNSTPVVPTPDLTEYGEPTRRMTPQELAIVQQQRRMKRDQHWQRYRNIQMQQYQEPTESSSMDDEIPTSSSSSHPIMHSSIHEDVPMVVHHEEIHMEHHPHHHHHQHHHHQQHHQHHLHHDDQQPCTSASLYHQ